MARLISNIDIHPWNGLFGTAAGASIRTLSISLNLTAPGLYEVTVPISPAQAVPKAFWVAFTPRANKHH